MEAGAAQAPADAGPVDTGAGQVEGAPDAGAQAPQGEQAAQPDLGQLAEQLATQGEYLEDLRAALIPEDDGQPQGQWQQPQAQWDEPPQQAPGAERGQDFSFLDPNTPGYTPENAAAQFLSVLQQNQQQEIQQAFGPLQDQLAEFRASQEADALASEFPELEKPEVAEQLLDLARSYAQKMHPDDPAQAARLASKPDFWRVMYGFGRQLEAAQGAAQAPNAATLEGANGASPGGADQGFTAESILGAAPRKVLPF